MNVVKLQEIPNFHKPLENVLESLKNFIAYYPEIYKYNKLSLKYFHKNYYHLIQNLIHSPFELTKFEINKKILSSFKIFPLFDYVSAFYPDNLEKVHEIEKDLENKICTRDFSLIFKIIKKVVMNLMENIKEFQSDSFEKLQLLQILPILNSESLKNLDFQQYDKACLNIMVIEYMEYSDITVCIIPESIFLLNPQYNMMQPTLRQFNELMENAMKPSDFNQEPDEFILKCVPQEIIELYKKLFKESIRFSNEHFLDVLFEWYFCERSEDFPAKRPWKVDKNFLIEFYWVCQIMTLINFMFSACNLDEFYYIFLGQKEERNFLTKKEKKNVFDLLSSKSEMLDEMIKRKMEIGSNLKPNTIKESKEVFKNVYKETNINYLIALNWIGSPEFLDLFLFNVGKSDTEETLLDNWVDFSQPQSPLKLFYLYLMKIQVILRIYIHKLRTK